MARPGDIPALPPPGGQGQAARVRHRPQEVSGGEFGQVRGEGGEYLCPRAETYLLFANLMVQYEVEELLILLLPLLPRY